MNETLARARARLMRAREEFLQRQGDHRAAESELLGVREPDHVDAAQAEDTAIPLDSLNHTERGWVEEIDAALQRIERGEYGVCEECGEPIEPQRLDAVPWARRCFADETEFEK
ncbi:MAG TPA: TraR/DksA family transcriptional regulator, partial [Kofleriaceae bacterium]|nr:TraR/DksA family transcriptional regulator [Kofleriaceae bacterium]